MRKIEFCYFRIQRWINCLNYNLLCRMFRIRPISYILPSKRFLSVDQHNDVCIVMQLFKPCWTTLSTFLQYRIEYLTELYLSKEFLSFFTPNISYGLSIKVLELYSTFHAIFKFRIFNSFSLLFLPAVTYIFLQKQNLNMNIQYS